MQRSRKFKWLVRISVSYEYNLLKDIKRSIDGVVVDPGLAFEFENTVKGLYADILRLESTVVMIDPNLTPLTCPPSRKWVEDALNLIGFKQHKPPLDISTLTDEKVIDNIAKSVIGFQRKFIPDAANRRILEFFEVEMPRPEKKTNYVLLAPYFAITDIDDLRHYVNLKLLEYSIRYKRENEQLYAVIAFSKKLLYDEDAIKKLINNYSRYNKDVDGYAIWIVDFEEISENESMLDRYVQFLKMLKQEIDNKPVINLYGDYFSLLLARLSLLDGIVIRVCYRQTRSLCPSEEGGPGQKKYYLRLIKKKVSVETAAKLMKLEKDLFGCNCPICQSKGHDIVNAKITKITELKKHFLYAFSAEVEHVANSGIKDLLNELIQHYKVAKQYEAILESVEHLNKWHNVISKNFQDH